MSPRLALHFLGPPQLYLDKAPVTVERRKSLALLSYLAIERDQHRRESLSSLLWPEYNQSSAFKNLRQVLWEVQQSIGEGWLLSDRDTICLNGDAHIWLDVREFESLIPQSNSQDDIPRRIPLLEDAAKLYRNHFLTGFSLKDAQPFNEWAFAVSEDLRRKLSHVLTRLSEDYCALGQARQAIPHARRQVSLDPLDESAHRLLMEIYLHAGQQNAALKQYQTFEQTLRKELNLDPQPETRELYKKIRKGEAKPVPVEKRTETTIPPDNLPHPISTFIGREKEQNEIINLLAKKRLATLVGAGGIGKTSLSLQVGRKQLTKHPGGVWFIALDSLADPALITQTVAALFDIRESGDRPLLDKLTDSLRPKNALLMLDNCEHLLEACAQLIAALLARCPNLKVLATSREALGIPGEAIYTMPSLPLPEGDSDSVEKSTEFESVKLFAERAALAQTSFQLTQENIQTVIDICRKVDGIPLAIELAAARVSMLQVDEILKQLQDSFALLSSDSRAILPRHQTLKASLDWGWGLLNDSEQRFISQLSVFAGGWTLEAAQAVCDGDVLGMTGALVKKSLIVVDQYSGRETRYRFHEMVREYVHEKCQETGEEAKVHDRHLHYFLDLSKRAELGLRGSSRVDWMDRLENERNNIRVALHWADRSNVEAGLYLASMLMRYWESSNLPEGVQWMRVFIQKPGSHDFPHGRALALHAYGWLLAWLQKFDDAYSVTEESLNLFRTVGDRAGEVDVLILLGNMLQFKDEMKSSIEMGNQALRLSQSIGDRWREANSLNYLGWGHGDLKTRFGYWEKAIHLYREVGDQINLANLLGLLGQFQVLNSDFERGERNLDEALLLWQSNKRANIWENSKIGKSLIALTHGRYEEAQALLEEVLLSAEQTGNRMSYLWAQVRLGYVAFHAGNLAEARQLLSETARDFTKDGYTIGTIFALEGLAGLSATVGKMEHAARLIGWADAFREKIADPRPPLEQADVDLSIAACVARMGKSEFLDAYDAGRKMSLEEAVTFALEEN